MFIFLKILKLEVVIISNSIENILLVRLKVGMGKKNTYNVGKGFYNGMIFYGGGKGGGLAFLNQRQFLVERRDGDVKPGLLSWNGTVWRKFLRYYLWYVLYNLKWEI